MLFKKQHRNKLNNTAVIFNLLMPVDSIWDMLSITTNYTLTYLQFVKMKEKQCTYITSEAWQQSNL